MAKADPTNELRITIEETYDADERLAEALAMMVSGFRPDKYLERLQEKLENRGEAGAACR